MQIFEYYFFFNMNDLIIMILTKKHQLYNTYNANCSKIGKYKKVTYFLIDFVINSYIYDLTARDSIIIFMRYTYPACMLDRYETSVRDKLVFTRRNVQLVGCFADYVLHVLY